MNTKNKITGRIVRADNGIGIENLKVVIFDIDTVASGQIRDANNLIAGMAPRNSTDSSPLMDTLELIFGKAQEEDMNLRGAAPAGDRLGSVLTDTNGQFEFEFEDVEFEDGGKEKRPDILLTVIGPDTSQEINGRGIGMPELLRLVHMSIYPSWNAGRQEAFFIKIPESLFEKAGLPTITKQKKISTAEKLKRDLEESKKERESIKKVQIDALKPELTKIKNLQKKSNEVVKKIFDTSAQIDKPYFISGTLSASERREQVNMAKKAAISDGLDNLNRLGDYDAVNETYTPKPHTLFLPEEILSLLIPNFPGLDVLTQPEPFKVTIDTLCGLINGSAGGRRLVRSKDIKTLIQKNQPQAEPDADTTTDSDTPDPVIGPNLNELTAQQRIQLLVEDQIKDVVMSQEVDTSLPSSTLARLHADLDNAVINPGPADTTSFHDFHTLQIAFENVWADSLSSRAKFLGRLAYLTNVRINGEIDPEDDSILLDEIASIEELIEASENSLSILSSLNQDPNVRPSANVLFIVPDIVRYWPHMYPTERAILEADCSAGYGWVEGIKFEAKSVHTSIELQGTYFDEINARRNAAIEYITGLSLNYDSQTDNVPRLKRLLNEFAEILGENYRFQSFEKNSTNFGIITTYRQTWEPGKYQVGSLAKTIPLAPGETRSFEVRQTTKTSRSRKEIDKNSITRSSDTSQTSRLDSEVVQRAEEATNFSTSTTGGLNFGIGSISNTTAFTADQKRHSQDIKKNFREAVLKSAQEVKSERSFEVNLDEDFEFSSIEKGELKNPNNELTVTYLLYELERQYKISEKIHALTPVIMVAQEMPEPDDITEAWLLRHDWVINRVLLDQSFLTPLKMLRDSFVSDEISIALKKANWEKQLEIVGNLQGEEKKWLSNRRSLQEELVLAKYNKSLLEAREDSEGFLKKLTDATFIDAGGISVDNAQAAIDKTQGLLEIVESEYSRAAELLTVSRDALNIASKTYSDAVEKITHRRTLIDQLRIHVKDNILHYMQAIWSYEPNDQRYFRLYKQTTFFPDASRIEVSVRRAQSDDLNGVQLPGVPGPNVVIEGLGVPEWSGGPNQYKPLHEVADLDKPLGFKGNYMLFPLKKCNVITDFMMSEFVDGYFGMRDPDALSEFTNEELAAYAKTLEEDQATMVNSIIGQRLDTSYRDTDTIVMPTGQIYMEALIGTNTLLEPFKLAHRGYDALSAREELRRKGLENLRYAARMVSDEPDLEDPDVDKNVKIKGGGDIIVDTD